MKWFETLLKYPVDVLRDGTWVFLTRVPLTVIVLGLAALVAGVYLLYRRVRSRVPTRRRGVLVALRAAFLTVLLFILATPAIQAARNRSGAVFTAVLIDTSRSMSLDDADVSGRKVQRIELARDLLTRPIEGGGGKSLLEQMGRYCRIVTYGFDRDVRRESDPASVRANGPYTDIFGAVRDVDEELRGVPLGAVVLLTDGARNTGGETSEAARILRSRGVPLFVIGVGNPNPPRDYEVVQVLSPRTVRRNSEVEIHATVRNTGFDVPFPVKVMRGATTLTSVTVQPSAEADLQRVKLSFTPDHEGTAAYKVVIPNVKDEAVADNNGSEFMLEIQDDRLPVLYIEGSPRMEYRFLRRALFRDRDFRLVGMLRLAKDRFYAQGANDREQYLKKGFPDTAERLFAFQTVILGDIEAATFTPAQLKLLEEFVRVRGGGLIMLGGVNSFGLGGYAGTPVGKMLPVSISPADPPYSDEQYHAVASDSGLKHPVMQLAPDPVANQRLWESAPPLIGITPVRGVKAGGTLLLGQDRAASGRSLPVLAVQNYGQGRVAAFTSGGSWYWQMSRGADDEFHEKFWKQLIRWLVVGAREQLTVEMDADLYARKDPVILRATVLARDLRPVNDATVRATITDPLGNRQELPMDWILSREGVYQCRIVPEDEGAYTVSVRVEGAAGAELKPVATEFKVSVPLVEFNDTALKEPALRDMARIAGGQYYTPYEAVQLADDIETAMKAVRQAGIQPRPRQVWDMPLLLGLLIVLAAAEWTVRRRSGLA